jgi:citrate lyase subunit beta/citryl-CoA lyase
MEDTPIDALRWRSCLSTPASDPRMVRRAVLSDCDLALLDLEDSVTPVAKVSARQAMRDLRHDRDPRSRSVGLRINELGSAWCDDDLRMVASNDAFDCVFIPKVSTARDVAAVSDRLDEFERDAGRRHPISLVGLIETARGLVDLADITDASPRLCAVTIGYADLSVSLGRSPRETHPAAWTATQSRVTELARSRNLLALEGPWLGTADDAGFRESTKASRALGFDGQWVVHPAQIEFVNATYSPSVEELERARAVLSQLESAAKERKGATMLEGQMIDEAVAVWARETLARAQER